SPYLKYEDLDRYVHQLFSTVNEAKIFVYNNFPVSLANGVDFDLLIIIGIPDKIGNYYRLKYDERGKSVYLHNQIIPVKIITDYGDDEILVRKNELYTESDVLDFEELLASNKFGLKDYLVKRCAF